MSFPVARVVSGYDEVHGAVTKMDCEGYMFITEVTLGPDETKRQT